MNLVSIDEVLVAAYEAKERANLMPPGRRECYLAALDLSIAAAFVAKCLLSGELKRAAEAARELTAGAPALERAVENYD